jgi:quercetin dioxygenase-like cupin family protein
MPNNEDLHLEHGQTLADMVQYQPGAVVSRTLIKKPAGTVTLFAFDAGEELSEHTAPYEALVVVLDGAAEITVGGQQHRVGAHEMLTLPAGVPHALKAAQAFKMMLVMIRD